MTGLGTKNILTVMPAKFTGDEERQKCLSALDVALHRISPTLLSAFTAMTIASECAKRDIHLVHTYRTKDAMAAISARRISKKTDFKIVLEFADNAPRPLSISKDVAAGVDAWVFATDRLAGMAPADKPTLIMSPRRDDTSGVQPDAADKLRHLLWTGPLEKNIDTLKDTIRLVGESDGDIRLTVLGTGSARYAMQAVKMSRTLPHPEAVQWKGTGYMLDDIMPTVTAIVQSQAEPTPLEQDLACGLWLCSPAKSGFVPSSTRPLSAQDRAQRLYDFYRQL